MTRLGRLNRAVQAYDRDLFVKKEGEALHVFRRCKDWRIEDFNGMPIQWLYESPWRIISLTENWSLGSKPCEWGIDVVVNRLKACDLWNQGMTVADLETQDYESRRSKDRDMRNSIESFLSDYRSAFAKSTNDVNTSTLAKIDKRRLYDASCK